VNMPFVETLEEARHFIKGSEAYKGAPSPWKEPIKSPQRPETMNGGGDRPALGTEQPSGRWLPF